MKKRRRVPASPSTDKGATAPVDKPTETCPDKRVIVIDPGHGGSGNLQGSSSNNATSLSGPLEKELTLQFAKSLKSQLEGAEVQEIFKAKKYTEVKVLLTRETDVNVSAPDRVAVATNNKADILISIHFNGGAATVRGCETYYKASSNAGQSNVSEDMALASSVNAAMFGALKALDSGAKNRNVKPDTETGKKSLGVLRDPGIGLSGKMCRSILIEVEFVTNAAADQLLVSGPSATANRDSVMLAVAKALARTL